MTVPESRGGFDDMESDRTEDRGDLISLCDQGSSNPRNGPQVLTGEQCTESISAACERDKSDIIYLYREQSRYGTV